MTVHGLHVRVRGASLAELAISVVILGIIILAAFSIFTMNQLRVIRAQQHDQMVQVATNEAERVLAIPYNGLEDTTGRTVRQGGLEYTVDTRVVTREHPSTDRSSEMKEVTITVTAPSGDVHEIQVIRSP